MGPEGRKKCEHDFIVVMGRPISAEPRSEGSWGQSPS